MIESLVAFGSLGALIGRQHRSQFHSQQVGIHHLILGIAWVHAYTFYIYTRAGSIKVLKLQLAHVATIHRVAPFATELLHVKVVRTHANLLVGVKSHAYVAVLYLLMVAQVAHRLYYLGNARLIVGTKQSGTIRYNQVLACVLQQLGELFRTHHNTLAQQYVAAVVVAYNVWLNVSTRAIRAGIVMRNKSNGRNLVFRVGLQRCVNVTLLVHLHIAQSFVFQFFLQVLGKHQLFRRTRYGVTILSRLCVKLRIVYKSFCNIHTFFIIRLQRYKKKLYLCN